MEYEIGDIVHYIAFGGEYRRVRVTDKEDDIKNGLPGFDGEWINGSFETCWGYDNQIVEVEKCT